MRLVAWALASILLVSSCVNDASTSTTTENRDGIQTQIDQIQQRTDELEATNRDLQDREREAREARESIEADNDQLRQMLEEMSQQVQRLESARQAAEANLRRVVCSDVDTDLPEDITPQLTRWLIESESDGGGVPEDMEITIDDAAGSDGSWLFAARFSARFEPGVFATSGDGQFVVAWGGVADSEDVIRSSLLTNAPDIPESLAVCLDVSGFAGE